MILLICKIQKRLNTLEFSRLRIHASYLPSETFRCFTPNWCRYTDEELCFFHKELEAFMKKYNVYNLKLREKHPSYNYRDIDAAVRISKDGLFKYLCVREYYDWDSYIKIGMPLRTRFTKDLKVRMLNDIYSIIDRIISNNERDREKLARIRRAIDAV